jgi:hypothetical protein
MNSSLVWKSCPLTARSSVKLQVSQHPELKVSLFPGEALHVSPFPDGAKPPEHAELVPQELHPQPTSRKPSASTATITSPLAIIAHPSLFFRPAAFLCVPRQDKLLLNQ